MRDGRFLCQDLAFGGQDLVDISSGVKLLRIKGLPSEKET